MSSPLRRSLRGSGCTEQDLALQLPSVGCASGSQGAGEGSHMEDWHWLAVITRVPTLRCLRNVGQCSHSSHDVGFPDLGRRRASDMLHPTRRSRASQKVHYMRENSHICCSSDPDLDYGCIKLIQASLKSRSDERVALSLPPPPGYPGQALMTPLL